jgi:dTDP-4-amino-4,6-dideoxygalactose transaminase
VNPYKVIHDFEEAVAEYTGAPYCVTTDSCTNALLLCCKYLKVGTVWIPKFTYKGVADSIVNAGGKVCFRDDEWRGSYQLAPYPILDSARRFTSGMYGGGYVCLSFHWSKILGIQQGGAILHSDPEAHDWFKRMRFDGRREGVHPKEDTFDLVGLHCRMSPEIAAEGLVRLSLLPKHNKDLPNSDYSDLSLAPCFK